LFRFNTSTSTTSAGGDAGNCRTGFDHFIEISCGADGSIQFQLVYDFDGFVVFSTPANDSEIGDTESKQFGNMYAEWDPT